MVMGRGGNAQRYQESNITLRRYTEDKQVQETEPKRLVRGSLCNQREVILHNLKQTNPLRAEISDALSKTLFVSAHFYSEERKRSAVSAQAVKQDHMVSEGYRRIWSAVLPVPSHSVFFAFSFRTRLLVLIKWVLFIQVILRKQKKNKNKQKQKKKSCLFEMQIKRSMLSTTSIDQHLQHVKLNPGVQNGLGSKLLRHSSFPSKPLVTILRAARNSTLLLAAHEQPSPVMAAS